MFGVISQPNSMDKNAIAIQPFKINNIKQGTSKGHPYGRKALKHNPLSA